MPKKNPTYLTIPELMERWKCSYGYAYHFSHRKGSKSTKPAKQILIPLKEIEHHEEFSALRFGGV